MTATQAPPEHDPSGRALHSLRRSQAVPHKRQSATPTVVGLAIALVLLFVSAGATFFFLSKPPDEDRLYREGLHQLEIGQYAFALSSLEQASALRPHDPKVFLSLARAYVGVDQVDKAWQCISQAQQLGVGVVAEPQLASELANYYRQKAQYDKAISLLRPLAESNVPGKKAELADLLALYGDESLREGKAEQALKCWEEVRDLREGTRYTEAEARLATIYQKMASGYLASGKSDEQALLYLNRLNTIAQNPQNLLRASEIYEKQGKLELAIDQMRKAIKLAATDPALERKLASLLARRGKELLDEGETVSGYGYLQQAKALDSANTLPVAGLRNVQVALSSGVPSISGEVWNPGPQPLNFLNLRVELWDGKGARKLWEKSQKIVDEFMPPLGADQGSPFSLEASARVQDPATSELRVFIDGSLYKTYPLAKDKSAVAKKEDRSGSDGEIASEEPRKSDLQKDVDGDQSSTPLTVTSPAPPPPDKSKAIPEDKTIRDLDL